MREVRRLSLALALLAASACFDPAIQTGGPCEDSRLCPPGQVCSVDDICVEIGGDGDADAGTGLPIDSQVEPYEVAPSGTCDIGDAATSHGVAVDAADRIYLAADCGGEVAVAVSETGGRTFGAFEAVGIVVSPDTSMSISAGAAGQAVVVTIDGNEIVATATSDGGRTWSAPEPAGAASRSGLGLSIARTGSDIWVLAENDGPGLRVARNDQGGAGSWSSVVLDESIAFGDIVVDEASGNVYVVGDTPTLTLFESTDGGVSFGPDLAPAGGDLHYSDWDAADGRIIGVGEEDSAREISFADLSTAATLDLTLPNTSPRGRAVQLLANDEMIISSDKSGGGVVIERFEGMSSVERDLDPGGRDPMAEAVRSGVGVVFYRSQSALYISVQIF